MNVWRKFIRTGELEQLTDAPEPEYPYQVTSDGTIALVVITDDGRYVGLKGLHPDSERKLLDRGANPTISPDNRWLAYESSGRTGRLDVWVVPLDSDETPTQVSNGGGREPLFAPASRELFYRALDGAMMRVRYGSGPKFDFEQADRLFPNNRYTYREGLRARYFDILPDGSRFVMLKDALTEGGQPTIRLVLNLFEHLKRQQEQAK
jgi:hypothetical protein